MTETRMTLIDKLQKHDQGGYMRAVAEAVPQTLTEHDLRASSERGATNAVTGARRTGMAIVTAN
jgi:hypothetical protein